MKSESLIVKFFENTLSPKEQKEFNQLLAHDAEFKKEVEFQKELKDVITLHDRETIKQEFQALESAPQKSNFKMWRVAASVVLLLGVASFWLLNQPAMSSEDLFNAQFEPYRNVVQPIERGSDTTDLKILAFRAYEAGDYDTALKGFNTLLANESDLKIQFYKANVLLQLGKTDEAINILEKNITITDSLKEKHYWYLALAYLKLGNTDKTKSQLQPLLNNPNSDYKKTEANTLLKQLD